MFVGLILGVLLPLAEDDSAVQWPSRYEAEVRPILQTHCLKCHGGEDENPKGGLDLGSLKGMLAGGKSGEPAIVPGDPDSSPLIDVIASGAMPPKASNWPTARDLATLRDWLHRDDYSLRFAVVRCDGLGLTLTRCFAGS